MTAAAAIAARRRTPPGLRPGRGGRLAAKRAIGACAAGVLAAALVLPAAPPSKAGVGGGLRVTRAADRRGVACPLATHALEHVQAGAGGPTTLEAPDAPTAVFPAALTDVDGNTVPLADLAAHGRLFVVTLKATWCPVCQAQLVRLKALLPRLASCGASFVVLAPGPADELRAIARDTGFPYPFVVDEGLHLARAAGLVLAPDQIAPAILALDRERRVAWVQRGRSGAYFGDDELLEHLRCAPLGAA